MSSIEAPSIALIGGGSGSSTLLREFKTITPDITSIVSMSDNGGSTGSLCRELGVMPMGDVRQCLVALSNNPKIAEEYEYRYGKGRNKGHSEGNIRLAELEIGHGDFASAVKIASQLLKITGAVVPVTLDKNEEVMQDGDEIIRGEFDIAYRPINNLGARIWLEPDATLNPEAEGAIYSADIVAIAPGNLYGSLLPALAPRGLAEAMQGTQAEKVVISNLLTSPRQTDGWHVVDYVRKMEEYIGESTINSVLYNTQYPCNDTLREYVRHGEKPLKICNARFDEIAAASTGADLLANDIAAVNANDKAVPRSYIRHDPRKVGRHLLQIHDMNYQGIVI